MKWFKKVFNRRSGTPDSEPKANSRPSLAPDLDILRLHLGCECFLPHYEHRAFQELTLHDEIQDTESDAWKSLEDYIEEVHATEGDELNPGIGIGREKWEHVVTLPPSIAKLKTVKVLRLYGSHLVRIPPEIGEMTNLEEFDPYTSYRLHWFPYEITWCKKLVRSRVSTRALYGNYKFHPPFPRLPCHIADAPASCSVCRGPFAAHGPIQAWISLWVATDVLPLLVHACSSECLEALPKGPMDHMSAPHLGGLEFKRPPARPMGPAI